MTSKKQKAGAKTTQSVVSFKHFVSLFLACVCIAAGTIVWFSQSTTQAQGTSGIVGFDNIKEYLAELTLTDNDTPKTSFKVDGDGKSILEVSGTIAIGVGNSGGDGTNFIGGGFGNNVGGDNSLIFGGTGNSTNAKNGIIVGGALNQITGNAANAFLGAGSGNRINAGNSSFLFGGEGNNINNGGIILGMKGNSISGGVNNLVLGVNVKIPATISDTFVWSPTGSFSPNTGSAFYANTSGVGINTATPQVVFDSNGAIKFGSLSTSPQCTGENVGLVRYTGGYLCGCTGKGYWESLMETVIDSGTAACNADNPTCKYVFSGALNRYIFSGAGCPDTIIPNCHFVDNGFTYCFPIYFSGYNNSPSCNAGGVFPYCFPAGLN